MLHIRAVCYIYGLYVTYTSCKLHKRAICYIYGLYTYTGCMLHIRAMLHIYGLYFTHTGSMIHIRAICYIYGLYVTYTGCMLHIYGLYVTYTGGLLWDLNSPRDKASLCELDEIGRVKEKSGYCIHTMYFALFVHYA
jgi:hypothetical protein